MEVGEGREDGGGGQRKRRSHGSRSVEGVAFWGLSAPGVSD